MNDDEFMKWFDHNFNDLKDLFVEEKDDEFQDWAMKKFVVQQQEHADYLKELMEDN